MQKQLKFLLMSCHSELGFTQKTTREEPSRYSEHFPLHLNPLHPNISMDTLHTVFCTFPVVLTRRICLTFWSFLNWWSFLVFSWPLHSRVILWGEIRCQSLIGVKGLCGHVNSSAFVTGSGNCRVVICGGVCIINWPLPLGGFQGKYRQIEKLWVNGVLKSPKRQKVDQLAIYKV